MEIRRPGDLITRDSNFRVLGYVTSATEGAPGLGATGVILGLGKRNASPAQISMPTPSAMKGIAVLWHSLLSQPTT
jgi:hypothetical protein